MATEREKWERLGKSVLRWRLALLILEGLLLIGGLGTMMYAMEALAPHFQTTPTPADKPAPPLPIGEILRDYAQNMIVFVLPVAGCLLLWAASLMANRRLQALQRRLGLLPPQQDAPTRKAARQRAAFTANMAFILWAAAYFGVAIFGPYWPLAVAALLLVMILLSLFRKSVPELDHQKVLPMTGSPLAASLAEFAGRFGVHGLAVYMLETSALTPHAKAYYCPLPRPAIYLGDTTLSRLEAAEVQAVFAHELAHHRLRHAQWSLAAHLAILVAGLGIGFALTPWRFYGQKEGTALVPLIALLALWTTNLLGTPLLAWLSRRHEWQADELAMTMTQDPGVFARAMGKIALSFDRPPTSIDPKPPLPDQATVELSPDELLPDTDAQVPPSSEAERSLGVPPADPPQPAARPSLLVRMLATHGTLEQVTGHARQFAAAHGMEFRV